MSTALFLFPHYDDEFGIFEIVRRHIVAADRVVVIYLTSSHLMAGDSEPRLKASLRALERLGVDHAEDVFTLGKTLGIADLKLHNSLKRAYDGTRDIVKNISDLTDIYTPAYEGGHPDHDSAFVLASLLLEGLNPKVKGYQFPLYSGKFTKWNFFSLFSPLSENGPVFHSRIAYQYRWLYLALFASYFLVQPKTILGLSLSYAFHLFLKKDQVLQNVELQRIYERPHLGALLYERRKMGAYSEFRQGVNRLLTLHLPSVGDDGASKHQN